MSKILITGKNGFIGNHFELFLKGHYSVEKISLREPLTIDHLIDAKAIIHLAGLAHDTSNTNDSEEYFKINYHLSCHVFDLFLNSSADVFIYFSSIKAAVDYSDIEINEDINSNPGTPYGISKRMAEEYMLKSDFRLKGKRVYILRPCLVYGKGNRGNLSLLIDLIEKIRIWPLVSFENKRTFLSINNLSFIIDEILVQFIPSGIYHLADTEKLSTNELVSLIAKARGISVLSIPIPKLLIRSIARLGDLFSMIPLNTERLNKLTENYCVSNAKILSALKTQLPYNSKHEILNMLKQDVK